MTILHFSWQVFMNKSFRMPTITFIHHQLCPRCSQMCAASECRIANWFPWYANLKWFCITNRKGILESIFCGGNLVSRFADSLLKTGVWSCRRQYSSVLQEYGSATEPIVWMSNVADWLWCRHPSYSFARHWRCPKE